MLLLLIFMGLVAELVAFFVLWPEDLLIAFAGATVAGVLAMVATGISLSIRRKEPKSQRKEADVVDKTSD
jgi:hypothetical protein